MNDLQTESGQITSLYRHYARGGRLLYVGISLSAIRRLGQHIVGAQWEHMIAEVKIERFPSRQAAIAAEAVAIREERPVWNKMGRKSTSGLPLASFPASYYETDGAPMLATELHDVECDPYTVEFHNDGAVRLDTRGLTYLLISSDDLEFMADKADQAREWYSTWEASRAGRAWRASQEVTDGAVNCDAMLAARGGNHE